VAPRPSPSSILATAASVLLAVLAFALTVGVTGKATTVHAAVQTTVPHARPEAKVAYPAPPAIAYSETWAAQHGSPPLDGLQAQAAVLVDLDHHQVLWTQGAHDVRAPASLAKIMTVLVALDKEPLDRTVTVPDGAVDNDPDHTTMGLAAGEQVTVRELLYGVFLVSGNDAAETLAQTAEPRADFIADMNVKAAALGMKDTRLSNPTGLDQPGESSSAYDLALATGYLEEQHPDLLAIAQQPEVWLYANAGHPEFDLVNLNKLILWPYPGATGLKTGYTDAAGGCVAGTAERDGRHLVAVVLGSDVMFSDAQRLFDYGFSVWGQ
jgi:serine-type D-Ala-D-Ala carboxypeptidase (penicillin-binding protein 5/6)